MLYQTVDLQRPVPKTGGDEFLIGGAWRDVGSIDRENRSDVAGGELPREGAPTQKQSLGAQRQLLGGVQDIVLDARTAERSRSCDAQRSQGRGGYQRASADFTTHGARGRRIANRPVIIERISFRKPATKSCTTWITINSTNAEAHRK